jgi:tripartite-type tricarboxylate transporter receptor subunit TctC
MFNLTRHRVLRLTIIGCGALFAVLSMDESRAAWPERPIRWIVPAAPGGAADSAVRVVAEELSRRIGQPVIVDNRPGGSGVIGLEALAKAAPDGYTIGTANLSNFVMNLLVRPRLPFDPERDFQPVAKLTNQPNVLGVSTRVPVSSVKELIAYAKSHPNELLYGSSGSGSSLHIITELLKFSAGIDLVHVPYKSTPMANNDLIGHHIQLMIDNLSTMAPHIRSGKVRALAVTSASRSAVLPDVPTMIEAGLAGFEATVWGGVVAPAQVPTAVVERLNVEINAALATPGVERQLTELGYTTDPLTPTRFAEMIRLEREKWSDVVRRAGIKAD